MGSGTGESGRTVRQNTSASVRTALLHCATASRTKVAIIAEWRRCAMEMSQDILMTKSSPRCFD